MLSLNTSFLRDSVIACAVIATFIFSSVAWASQSSAEVNRRLGEAFGLLIDKGYVDANCRPSATGYAGSVTPEMEQMLDRALEAFDYEVVNAIGLMHKYGVTVVWTAKSDGDGMSTKASSTAGATISLPPAVAHILDQVYGARGSGYLLEEQALRNSELNRDIAEVYSVSQLAAAGDGWHSLQVSIGHIDSKQVTIPLMIHSASGQVIEYYGSEDRAEVTRSVQPYVEGAD